MRRALVSLIVSACVASACSVRLGQGPPSSNNADGTDSGTTSALTTDGGLGSDGDTFLSSFDGGDAGPPSACAHASGEAKIPAGAGTNDFSFVWDTDHYVVAYVDPRYGNGDIYTILLNPDGSARGPATVVESTPAASALPSLLITPTGYLVAWEEGSAGLAVYLHALDKNAQPTGEGVTVASTDSSQARPVLSLAPGGVAITWMDSVLGVNAVDVALLDMNLMSSSPMNVAPTSGGAGWPWIAGDASHAAIAWSDHRAGEYDVHFADLSAGPAMQGDEALRSGEPNDALLPRMIETSFGFMAAWEDMRGSDNQIFMSMVDPTGKVLAQGLVEDPNSGDANWPNIAWDGTAAAVVYYQWREGNPEIYISYVNTMGQHVRGLNDLQVSGTPGDKSREVSGHPMDRAGLRRRLDRRSRRNAAALLYGDHLPALIDHFALCGWVGPCARGATPHWRAGCTGGRYGQPRPCEGEAGPHDRAGKGRIGRDARARPPRGATRQERAPRRTE